MPELEEFGLGDIKTVAIFAVFENGNAHEILVDSSKKIELLGDLFHGKKGLLLNPKPLPIQLHSKKKLWYNIGDSQEDG